MSTAKRISPFAANIKFRDVATLIKAFEQKAAAEDWTSKEISAVVKEAGKDLDQATKVINSYTEQAVADIDFIGADEDEKFNPLEDDEEDRFKGDDDFVVEDR